MSSLALPLREISHLLPNCTTRSWTHRTHYSLIITLKTLHRCALNPPQLILLSPYTMIPAQIFQLSTRLGGGRRGTWGGKKSRKKKMGDKRTSGGPLCGNELSLAGRLEALLWFFCLWLTTPPFTAFHLLRGSHTSADMAQAEGSYSGDLQKGLMRPECVKGFYRAGVVMNVCTFNVACRYTVCAVSLCLRYVGCVFWLLST